MYAPKFRSWMTEEERFMEALSYRLEIMANDAHSEIRKMAEDAMPKEPEGPEPPQTQDALLALYQQQMINMGPYIGSHYDGLGRYGTAPSQYNHNLLGLANPFGY
jgi:hypothetical protein